MRRAIPLLLAMAVTVNGQCPFAALTINLGSTMVSGGTNILAAMVTITPKTMATPAINCQADVPDTNECTLSATGYANADAVCTGTTWNVPTLTANACTDLMVANGPTVSGTTGQMVMATCNAGFSCNPCETTCQPGGTFDNMITCNEDCLAIPTLSGADVFDVAGVVGPLCVEGNRVPFGTKCRWVGVAGFTCMPNPLLEAECATGGAAMTNPPTCTQNECASYDMMSATTGIIPGPAGTPPPCSVPMVLGQVLITQCSLQCDSANGYVRGTGVLACAVAPAGGNAPTTTLTCSKVRCGAAFDFNNAGTVALAGGVDSCRDVGATACTLQCDPMLGYVQNLGGAPTLMCSQTTANPDVGEWTLTNPCIGPAMCNTFTCLEGYIPKMNPNTILCKAVSQGTGANTAVCTVGDAGNNGDCCNLADCPTNAAGMGCPCNPGFMGTPVWSVTGWTHTCTPITCSAFAFQAGFVGGDITPCTDGVILTADTSCSIKCGPEYVPQTASVACSITGTLGAVTMTCTPKVCAAFPMPTGAEGGTCNNNIVLSPLNNPSCTVQCMAGWSGGSTTITCPTSIATGAAPTGSLTCTQNMCAPFTPPTGVQAGGMTPCPTGTGILSGATCTVECAPGWAGAAGTVSCPAAAAPNAPTTGGITCQLTCSSFVCPTGYRQKPNPATVMCTANTCSNAQCCDVVPCPTAATTTTAGGVTTLCACNTGYTGTPNWNTMTLQWTHTCEPNCAHPQIAACPAGGSRVANPASVLCTGPGGCDAMSCAKCLTTDCCVDLVCQPPGPLPAFPEYVFGGGRTCTTTTACAAITCARGYLPNGTPRVTCNTAGAQLLAQGCDPAPCPTNAGGDGTCACNAGFAVTGGGPTVWSPTTGWGHTCTATCDNVAFTGCTTAMLSRKDNAAGIFCTGGGGNPATDCTTAVCCSATCDQFQGGQGCAMLGLTARLPMANFRCSGTLVTDCDAASCCQAKCSNPAFTGCAQAGWRPKLGSDAILCSGSQPSSCNQTQCCEPTVCGNFPCSEGSTLDTTQTACPSQTCTQNLCCVTNQCQKIPAGTMLEYDIGDRATCVEVAQCGQVRCAAGYKVIPGQTPQLFCDVTGGPFRATGCVENVCSPVGTLPGYVVSNGPLCNRTSTCGAVTCAQGYNDNNGMSNPRVICPIDGGAMSGVDCFENVCLAPNSNLAQWQQDKPQIVVANMGCTTLNACGALSCAVGWSGTAQMQCLVPGQQFVVGGCNPNDCIPPGTSHPGYTFTVPTCKFVKDCGDVACDRGFTGTPNVTCPTRGGPMVVTGCSPTGCPTNAAGSGCLCNQGYVGLPVWDDAQRRFTHTCTPATCPSQATGLGCPCNAGFTGTPVWAVGDTTTNGRWTHSCTAITCTAPGAIVGYTHGCTTSGNLCNTNVACANGYRRVSTPTLTCTSSGWTGAGCASTCPTGGVRNAATQLCQCGNGFTGTLTWNAASQTYTGSCTAASCPSGGTGATCPCPQGFLGNQQWDATNNRWVTTPCTVAPCPTGASGTGCRCTNNANVNPVWVPVTGWTHTCTCTDSFGATYCANEKAKGNCADNEIIQRCGCTCAATGGNIAPTATRLNNGVVCVAPGLASYNTQVLQAVSGGEAGQIVTSTGCTTTNSALFTTQPTLVLSGTVANLAFASSAATGTTATVTCNLRDNGAPQQTTPFVFTVNFRTGGVGCTNTGTNNAPTFIRTSNGLVCVAPGLASYNTQVLQAVSAGEAGQIVTSTGCTATNPALFTTQPTLVLS
eukprot:Rhum_TRINITY_DN13979_c1_g1::Rhum_TRINITY_DN13979_c1_g1_i3::g.65755::m.65755